MNFSSEGKQLCIDDFKSLLADLNKSNRWVELGDTHTWDVIEKLYNKRLNNGKSGAGNKSARMIVGALVIKHKMNLSDEKTILAIQENLHMQYFVDLSEFTDKPTFDSSLFVTTRKRLGTSDSNDMSISLLTLQVEKARITSQPQAEDKDKLDNEDPSASNPTFTDSQGRHHESALKIDTTCADAEVRYPTNIVLLHDSCKVINRYIDKLYTRFSLVHPTTYYKSTLAAYLEVIKRKKKSKSLINKSKSHLLTYLDCDIRSLIDLIAINGNQLFDSLKHNEKKIAEAILKMYHQQEQMFKEGSHSCANRINSIFHSYVWLIVRGKSKSTTEFGAKIGASIVQGYTFVDHQCWDIYNESSDLSVQIEPYRERFGFLPAIIYADVIYMSKENRKLLKELEIQDTGKPLGRPPKQALTKEYQAEITKAVGERNEIEVTFRTGKRIYRANNIRAKFPETVNCWTDMCYFVKNVMDFLRELLHSLIFVINLLANTGNMWRVLQPFPKFAYCGFLNG